MRISQSLSINLRDEDSPKVDHYCDHSDGTSSWKLGAGCFIVGDAAELRAFADACTDAANRYDEEAKDSADAMA